MSTQVFGHAISEISEGITEIRKNGKKKNIPLKNTIFKIDVKNGLAIIKTIRIFSNNSKSSIEALITFPIPFDATLTGLTAEIDGRRLVAVSKSKDDARGDYEDAVDQGKMAILHEEPLRGIHMLSIGQLGSNKTVVLETEMVMNLVDHSGIPFLRIPLTVGEIYGFSPLLPSDSILTSADMKLSGQIFVTESSGRAKFISGATVESGMSVPMNKSIEVLFPDQILGEVTGFDAWGRKVSINLKQSRGSDKNLDVAILLDRSGSTNEAVGQAGKTIRVAIEEAVRSAIRHLSDNDNLSIWEFDDEARLVKAGFIREIKNGYLRFSEISGGTQIGNSIASVIKNRPSAVIVLTDGQSYANEVQEASKFGYPISAVLVGPGSLDAMIGHLSAQTGGQVYAAAGDEVLPPLVRALGNLRNGVVKLSGSVDSQKPQSLATIRGCTEIKITWSDQIQNGICDAVGRYAMALSMPLFNDNEASELAELHGLVTHLTSLIIIDHEGSKSNSIPQSIKIALPVVSNSISVLSDMSYSSATFTRVHKRSIKEDYVSSSNHIEEIFINKLYKCTNINCGAEFFADDKFNDPIICKWCGKSLNIQVDNFREIFNLIYSAFNELELKIDWDNFSLLYYSNYSQWPAQIVELINNFEGSIQLKKFSEEMGLSIPDLIIFCLSICDRKIQRSADRFFRNLLSRVAVEKKMIIEEGIRLLGDIHE
jgi:hypothetical protein